MMKFTYTTHKTLKNKNYYMLKINHKNFQENVIETINEYLDANPHYDVFDQGIILDDLEMDDSGNIVHPFSWKTHTYQVEGHGMHDIHEQSNVRYAILLNREQLRNELKAYAKKCI